MIEDIRQFVDYLKSSVMIYIWVNFNNNYSQNNGAIYLSFRNSLWCYIFGILSLTITVSSIYVEIDF